MNVREARKLMYDLLSMFFSGGTVTFGSQSSTVKPQPPLVVLTTVSISRPTNPPTKTIDGHPVSYYPTTMALQIDLYTKGAPVDVGDGNKLVPMENTALSDMVDFANFLGSEYFINWCHKYDVAIAPNGDVRDTTALLNGSSYQFRSTLELTMNFTQKAVGYAGILSPTSIKHTTPEGEAEGDDEAEDVYVEPEFTPSSSGGGTAELAEEIAGYFEEAEIKEDNANGQ